MLPSISIAGKGDRFKEIYNLPWQGRPLKSDRVQGVMSAEHRVGWWRAGKTYGPAVRIVCAVCCPIASAASTVPISGPA